MQTNLRTLGPKEAQLVLTLSEQGRDTITTTEAIDMLGSEGSARNVLHGLAQKGWLTRLVGGRYLFLPPERGPENLGENNALALASALVEPSYVGWWAAAAFHGFTTQKPSAISVAALRQRPPRRIEDTLVRFVKLAPRKFFGFEEFELFGRTVRLSSLTKTIVDCVDRPDLCGGPAELARIVFGGAPQVDPAALVADALRMQSTALLQRLGFLTDLVGRPLDAAARAALRAAVPPAARSSFGRPERRPDDVGFVGDWGLRVHARRRDLLADIPRLSV